MQTGSWQFSESDQAYVTQSLGRLPVGVVGVAARGPGGNPTVIINLPLVSIDERWQPFPTLYWLIDPELSTQVSEVERKGGVDAIEAALQADEELMRAHLVDNRWYARARWAVLNPKEVEIARTHGLAEPLESTGVGGVANHESVKCLHAHLAFHLARNETGTTVGRLLKKRYDIYSKT